MADTIQEAERELQHAESEWQELLTARDDACGDLEEKSEEIIALREALKTGREA